MRQLLSNANEVLYAVLHTALWVVLFGSVTASVASPLGALLSGGGLA